MKQIIAATLALVLGGCVYCDPPTPDIPIWISGHSVAPEQEGETE